MGRDYRGARIASAGAFLRAIALDAPGCGTKRGRSTDELTLNDVAEEMIDDIRAAGLQRPLLVGHSQGGQVMSLMIEKRPDLFRRAVYLTCSIPLPGQSVQAMMGSGLFTAAIRTRWGGRSTPGREASPSAIR